MKVNTDHNFLIHLEQQDSDSAKKILELYEQSKITLIIPGIGASEKLKNGIYAETYQDFIRRLEEIFIREPKIQHPPMVLAGISADGDDLGGTYLDESILSDGSDDLENIHNVLSRIEFDLQRYCDKKNIDINCMDKRDYHKWWNSMCDTITVWSHVVSKGDLLITNDKNLLKKKQELIDLGAKEILANDEALEYIQIGLNL